MLKRFIVLLGVCLIGLYASAQPVVIIPKGSYYNLGAVNSIIGEHNLFWIGGEKGLTRFDPEEEIKSAFSGRTTSKPVLSMLDAGRFIWVGIAEKGLYLFNKSDYQFKGFFKSELGQSSIHSIFKIGEDQIGLATSDNKLYRFSISDTTFGGECSDNAEVNRSYEDYRSDHHQNFENGIFPIGDVKILFTTDTIWKLNESDQRIFLYPYAYRIPTIKSRAGIYHLFGSEDALVLYNPKQDTSKFVISKIREQEQGQFSNKEQEQVDEPAEMQVSENSTAPLTRESTQSEVQNNWWLTLVLSSIFGAVVFFILRWKYQKDINLLEEEIIRLKKSE